MKKYPLHLFLKITATLLFLGTISECYAAYPNNACGPANGSTTTNYVFNVNSTITNPEDNRAGALPPVTESSSGQFSLYCQCDPTLYPNGVVTHQWTTSPLDIFTTANGLTFYNINEYIAAAIEIKDEGNGTYYPVPWNNHYIPKDDGTYPCNTAGDEYHTGNHVRVTFYMKRSFVGQVNIPSTIMAQLWYTVTDTFIPGKATASLSINGTVTVPESCEINAGQMLTVELGQTWAGSFKTPGQKPKGYTPKTLSIPVQCNDMASTANLEWRMVATPSAEYPDAIQSSNSGIGVVVADMQGTTIPPETGKILLTLNDTYATTINVQAWPVKTIEGTPEAGSYNAVATMRIDFQ